MKEEISRRDALKIIGTGTLDAETQFVLESAALVHDIGIRASEKKYRYQNGKLQE